MRKAVLSPVNLGYRYPKFLKELCQLRLRGGVGGPTGQAKITNCCVNKSSKKNEDERSTRLNFRSEKDKNIKKTGMLPKLIQSRICSFV